MYLTQSWRCHIQAIRRNRIAHIWHAYGLRMFFKRRHWRLLKSWTKNNSRTKSEIGLEHRSDEGSHTSPEREPSNAKRELNGS